MTDSSDDSPPDGASGAGSAALAGVATLRVDTETGPARVVLRRALRPRLALVLGHGAGGGVDAPDLRALAGALPVLGVTVARVEAPWRVAGRRIAPAPARLDLGWGAVLRALRAAGEFATPVVFGGRSAGARVACRAASAAASEHGFRPAGVLALAFPLHPPGRPERSRVGELIGVLEAGVPLLVIQGGHDAFGRPEEFPAQVRVERVEAADHSFQVARSSGSSQERACADLAAVASGWLTRLAAGARPA